MKNLSSNNGKKVLIVESPTKSKKISSILGRDYKVLATFGHIRDLPEKHMGFSLNDIISGEAKITWEIMKWKVVNFLKKEVKNSSEVIIATDPDREGEAIAWHVVSILGLKDAKRAVFHEITKKAVLSALNSPRKIDMNLVSAQITRRLIDRIVGYTLSPVFFSIRKNSSAGRVQSAALHLIAKRWKEVKDFVRKPYFIVFADFGKVSALLYEKYEENGINRARVKHFLSEQEAK
jgi:DNA topoisomerase-1